LEQALHANAAIDIDLAIRRILLIHAVVFSIGGIPLIYLGDEVGTLNDYLYREDPAKSGDSRWVHRPFADWEKIDHRKVAHALEANVYDGLRRLIAVRKETAAFAEGEMAVIDADNPHVFGYVRQNSRMGRVLVLANLSEREQRVAANTVRNYGLSYSFRDLISGDIIALGEDLTLGSYQFVWLTAM
jgi:amylosucrase